MRRRIEALIEKHRGVIARMASDVEGLQSAGLADHAITPGALSRKLADLGLRETAAAARAEAGIGGRRDELSAGRLDPIGEREAIEQALRDAGGNATAAAAALGMLRRTFYKRLVALGIERPSLPSKATRRRELLVLLRAHGWSVNAAAQAEGIAAASMQGRLDRAGLDRADINRRRLRRR